MGRAASKLTRPLRNFNVENRAQKTLEKQKEIPKPAPRYPTISESLEKFSDDHPEYLQAQKLKYDQLVDNMRKLQLNSVGPPPEIRSKPQNLPESRSHVEETEYGFHEPDQVPVGKATVRQVIQFLWEHQTAPQSCTAALIAQEYKLDMAQVQQVLKHFQTLNMHVPKAMLDKNPKLLKSLRKLDLPQVTSAETPLVRGPVEPEGSKT